MGGRGSSGKNGSGNKGRSGSGEPFSVPKITKNIAKHCKKPIPRGSRNICYRNFCE